ncbi:MAG: hypothetical protein HUJ30_05190 [Gammaproteobacteria bacterium]|nr:hypothetical protein [Gammaproteobacteria bacterium]
MSKPKRKFTLVPRLTEVERRVAKNWYPGFRYGALLMKKHIHGHIALIQGGKKQTVAPSHPWPTNPTGGAAA